MPVGVAEALPLSTEEVDEISRRLHERDPQLDLHNAFPRLIASLREAQAQVQAQVAGVDQARRDVAELVERGDMLAREITRRDAVIEVARRGLASVQSANRPLITALDALDRGDQTLGG